MKPINGSLAALAAAWGVVGAQAVIPVRPIGRTVAVSPVPFVQPVNVRQLSGGRVLVNDATRHVVLSLDSMLANPVVVIDSTSGSPNSYGAQATAIFTYLGDSTLFLDPVSSSMIVLDPAGKVSRHMKAPPGELNTLMLPGAYGYQRIDSRGRLVYRFQAVRGRPGAPAPGALSVPPPPPDSAFIVAYDFATGTVETLGAVRAPSSVPSSGRGAATSPVPPPPPLLVKSYDEWAVTSTGRVAFVRGLDYHVDWVNADGARASSPKVAYDWKRMSDDDKARFADSATKVRDSIVALTLATLPAGASAGYDELGRISSIAMPGTGRPLGSTARPTGPIPTLSVPDYIPPFGQGAVRADEDGRLWVRSTQSRPIPGGLVYDIVDGTGTLIDRVQIPEGKTLLGFGAGGAVYLVSKDGGVAHVERARFR